jgi:hypothetical protein
LSGGASFDLTGRPLESIVNPDDTNLTVASEIDPMMFFHLLNLVSLTPAKEVKRRRINSFRCVAFYPVARPFDQCELVATLDNVFYVSDFR